MAPNRKTGYGVGQAQQNLAPIPFPSKRALNTYGYDYDLGQLVYQETDQVWSIYNGDNDWSVIGNATASILTINTISPDGTGNFTISAGSNISVTAGTNSITIAASVQDFTWNTVTGTSVAMAKANGYILSNVATTDCSLPANASTSVGDTVRIIGISGPFNVTQAALQQIALGTLQTTVGVGGSLSFPISNGFGSLTLICVVASGTYLWVALPEVGDFGVT